MASLDSPASQRVLADLSSVAWLQPSGSDSAYVLFVRENTLMAQPIDPKSLRPAGELFPVAEQILFGPDVQHAPVSVSDTGVLVYQSGSGLGESQIGWYYRAGKELAKVGASGQINELALSPDEKTLAVPRAIAGSQNRDIWLHELARGAGAETRFTFHASTNYTPAWLPDGARLDDHSLNNYTFLPGYVLMAYALPEEAQCPPFHRAGTAQAGVSPQVSKRGETPYPAGGVAVGFAVGPE